MEISLYHGLVMVFFLLVVPMDTGENGVIGHPRCKAEILNAQLQGIGLCDIPVFDFIQLQRGESRLHHIEAPQFQIVETQSTHLNILRTHREIKRIRSRGECTIQCRVLRDTHRRHQQPTDGLRILQGQLDNEILVDIMRELVLLVIIPIGLPDREMHE